MRVWLRRLFWGLAALGLLTLIVWGFLPQPVPVDYASVVVGPLRVTVDEDGKTRIRERYVVSAPLGGQLLRIVWKPGDRIDVNSPVLAQIEPKASEFLDPSAQLQAEAKVKAAEIARDKARTLLRQANVKVEFAQREADRLRGLRGLRSISEQEVENAIQQQRVASEEMRAAQQAIKIAEYELQTARAVLNRVRTYQPGEAPDRYDIYSPIRGVVLKVEQESATVVAPGQKLLEVGNPADLEVVIDVLSADAVKVRKGDRVILEHWGGEVPLEAEVRVVEPSGITKTSALGVEEQRVNVIANLTDPPASLGDGFRVEARIVVWEKADAIKVPAGALFRHGSGWAVYVVESGVARLRPVTVGKGNGLETQIAAGLEPGERVIIHAGDRVKDGTVTTQRQ